MIMNSIINIFNFLYLLLYNVVFSKTSILYNIEIKRQKQLEAALCKATSSNFILFFIFYIMLYFLKSSSITVPSILLRSFFSTKFNISGNFISTNFFPSKSLDIASKSTRTS